MKWTKIDQEEFSKLGLSHSDIPRKASLYQDNEYVRFLIRYLEGDGRVAVWKRPDGAAVKYQPNSHRVYEVQIPYIERGNPGETLESVKNDFLREMASDDSEKFKTAFSAARITLRENA